MDLSPTNNFRFGYFFVCKRTEIEEDVEDMTDIKNLYLQLQNSEINSFNSILALNLMCGWFFVLFLSLVHYWNSPY